MKRSNKILIIVVLLPISWLLLNGWLQANAFKLIVSGKSCSYAALSVSDNITQLHSFKNIKVDFDKNVLFLNLVIKYGKKQELSCSNNLKKAVSYSVSGDTLYLRIKKSPIKNDDYFTINIPLLKSVNMSSASDWLGGSYSDINHNITISGFNANTLSVNYNCQYELSLENNKLNKLELKGDFRNNGKVKISNYSDYDSLDVDVEGKHGTLIMSQNAQIKENPKQWISIKVPGTFHVETDATVARKIIIKK